MENKPTEIKTKAYQTRLFFVMILNLYLGVILVASVNAYQQFIFEGLYHKILIISSVSIPIGVITIIIFSSLFAFLFYLLIMIDYNVYKKGLEFIKLKHDKETV